MNAKQLKNSINKQSAFYPLYFILSLLCSIFHDTKPLSHVTSRSETRLLRNGRLGFKIDNILQKIFCLILLTAPSSTHWQYTVEKS